MQDVVYGLRYNIENDEIKAMSIMKQHSARLFLGLFLTMFFSSASFSADSAASVSQASIASIQHGRLETAFGTMFDVYEAGAKAADTAVLVVPGRWGVNADVKRWLISFSAMGYRTLALDLLDGRAVRDAEMAEDVWQAIDSVWIEADLQAAINYLRGQQRSVVVMAWDESVSHAMQLLQKNADVAVALVVADQSGVDAADLAVPMLEISGKGVRAGQYSDAALDAVKSFLETQF